ncbi:MAG TPA: sialidase family protein, partial [Verrucomicrobiae bacterium]
MSLNVSFSQTMTVTIRILLWTVFWISTGTVFCQTWTQTTAVDTNWSSLVSSADGSILAACGGTTNLQAIYISTNSGNAWGQTTLPMTNSTFALALSADGTRIFAGRNLPNKPEFVNTTNLTPFFYSTNSGQSWIAMGDATTNLITSVAMSGDGTVLVAALISRSGRTRLVYISTNSGANWSTNPVPAFPQCKAVANGQMVIAMLSNTLLVTTNAGTAWATNNLPGSPYSWSSCAASADGSKIALVGHYSYGGTSFALSTNAGASWNAKTVNASIYASGAIAASADGSKLILP